MGHLKESRLNSVELGDVELGHVVQLLSSHGYERSNLIGVVMKKDDKAVHIRPESPPALRDARVQLIFWLPEQVLDHGPAAPEGSHKRKVVQSKPASLPHPLVPGVRP